MATSEITNQAFPSMADRPRPPLNAPQVEQLCTQAERPPLPMHSEEVESLDADHAQEVCEVESQEEEKHTETNKERYERLLNRVLSIRNVFRIDASPRGFSATDRQAFRLHKVQEQWYACLDMALAQAERALMGMITTEMQYGGRDD